MNRSNPKIRVLCINAFDISRMIKDGKFRFSPWQEKKINEKEITARIEAVLPLPRLVVRQQKNGDYILLNNHSLVSFILSKNVPSFEDSEFDVIVLSPSVGSKTEASVLEWA